MRKIWCAAVVLLGVVHWSGAAEPAPKPNVLFILADDLGYGDVGVFYQNQRAKEGKPAFITPHLDAMAANGLMLRQHYTGSPVCAPARGSLMTGQSQGMCTIRDNEFDKPLQPNILTLGAVMKEAGYHTGAIGKWGLGGHKNSDFPAHPMKRGFDEFFGFMLHGTGHVYYHDLAHPLMDGMTDVKNQYENVYSTDLFTARAKKFITDHEAQDPSHPFFLYLAYTAVHNALDVPGEAYPEGAGKNGGMQWPLQPTPKTRNSWIHPDYANKPWTDAMKRYATMARRLDDGVGDITQLLKDLGIDQNTIIIFSSDNGPANEGGADPRLFDSWGPFDGFKRDVWEGGVREPTLVEWPGHVKAGKISDLPTTFWDWMPTLAELGGVAPPAQSDGISLVPTLLSKSGQREHPFIYTEYVHNGKNAASKDVFERKHVTGRGQQQLVRIGDYVGVRIQIKSADDPLRLYNVMKDPHEDHDLSKDPSQQALLKHMADLMISARVPIADAPRPYDKALMPAVEVKKKMEGLKVSVYEGSWPWTPDFGALKASSTEETSDISMPKTTPSGAFGLQYTGYITVPADGEYDFTATSDGGLHLWIHDAHVIEEENAGGKETTVIVRLKKGAHPIRLAYRHISGAPALSLKYSGPSVEEQVVPAGAFVAGK